MRTVVVCILVLCLGLSLVCPVGNMAFDLTTLPYLMPSHMSSQNIFCYDAVTGSNITISARAPPCPPIDRPAPLFLRGAGGRRLDPWGQVCRFGRLWSTFLLGP